MYIYTCDECKKSLDYPIYTLLVVYGINAVAREQHYHWKCLGIYIMRDLQEAGQVQFTEIRG